jgi:magnesium transporter
MPEQTFTPLTPELLYLLSSDPPELAETVAPFRGADVAESLNRMPPDAAAKVVTNLPFDLAVEVLDEPELEAGTAIISKMDRDAAGALLEEVAADRRADFLRQLPTRRRNRILDIIDEPTRTKLKTLLKYPRGTAGGLMTTEVLAIPSDVTVHDAIERAKAEAQDHQTLYVLYVTEVASGELLRALTLQDLLVAEPTQKITEVGDRRPPLHVHPEAKQDEVARLISKYNLLALPVVDKDHRILGVITVDDMIDEMVRETTEDVQKFGGVEALGKPYLRVSLPTMIRKRAGWLSALFLGEMLTATAMGHFEGEIAKAVVLSLFIPLIISSGGNSGSQATSLIIRAIALQEIRLRDWWRVAVRELPTGIALGSILGVIGVVRVLIWQHVGWYDYGPHVVLIALTMGTALVGVVTFGVLAGSLLPFVLKRLGFDPASASAPFVATLVDVTGLVIYFSVAFVILRGTLL